MTTHNVGDRIKLRRDEAYRWTDVNPILADGEPGVERDTGCLKIGDGVRTWSELPYFEPEQPGSDPNVPSGDSSVALSAHVISEDPHPVYDDGRSFALLYENAKV